MNIFEVNEYSEKLRGAVNALLPQLTTRKIELTENTLKEIIQSKNTTLFVAEDAGEILGMLTLITVQIPTNNRCIVEDVVVDRKLRGKGTGRKLMEAAFQKANDLGCDNMNLTSGPIREAANALYKKLGFEIRETNVYRKIL